MSNAPWCEHVKPGDILIPVEKGIDEMRIVTPAIVHTITKIWSKDILIYSFDVKCHRKNSPALRKLGAVWFEGIAIPPTKG